MNKKIALLSFPVLLLAANLSWADELTEATMLQTRTEMQAMSSEDRELYRQLNGSGEGGMNRKGYGSGNGSGEKKRLRDGSGNGSGKKNRYGQSDGGYGSGYGSRQGGGQGRH
ncbi:MAG: hypothetical protein HOM14_20205 [Gammaproteobacteria bacterium]|jgi:hypothetical protein|nr:hypothetical protein [Gammaproteobacteria bacterium]MBT3724338.1 hypothetical protein [Gammaproteobacteria bacterium]MBT4076109.1 hypothetical protein [Gammaproteobacteria bacterium]MBT4193601.1 hypothetical protein [Gammaproteobacteria bacterium]MBT4452042.1 hypothetical protein [Gammaproteobacteria bacterium]